MYRCRATRSDFWLPYAEVFPRRTHRLCGKGAGETCYVERFINTLRQRLGRLVRKTLSFSKCDRMHEAAVRLLSTTITSSQSFADSHHQKLKRRFPSCLRKQLRSSGAKMQN